MELSARARWLAQILEIALREEIISEKDLVAHVDPEVMAQHLPEEILGQVLSGALEMGELTAGGVIQTVTPQILAQHVPHELLWACVVVGAARAHMDKAEEP